jgi:hypothetical protein
MTTEQNQPMAQPANQAQPAGQTEGQGHRRRRRRRKGYSNNQAKGQANAEPGSGTSPASTPNHQQKKAVKSKSNGQGRFAAKNGTGGNGSAHQAVHNGSNGSNGGGRRKGKQRRQQVFVGPMDHSYRVVNGNTADAPHSAMEQRGNGNGHYVELPSSRETSVPIREDAPIRIYCFIEDLFFLAKIQEAARKIGVKVGFVKADKDIVSRLADVPEGSRPSLIVFDLNNVSAKPLTLIPRLKSKMKRGTSVIGFLSHLQGDLKAKAMEAGCDMVMPRSAFSQNLPNLLRRHGLETELEAAEA